MKKTAPVLLVITLILAGGVLVAYKYNITERKLEEAQKIIDTKNFNSKTLDFMKFFIEKVLNAKSEVSFEDRLKLETSVRELNDQDILSQWNKFIQSNNQDEAQTNIKEFLKILVEKIKIQ